jgi:hypothetical protein
MIISGVLLLLLLLLLLLRTVTCRIYVLRSYTYAPSDDFFLYVTKDHGISPQRSGLPGNV